MSTKVPRPILLPHSPPAEVSSRSEITQAARTKEEDEFIPITNRPEEAGISPDIIPSSAEMQTFIPNLTTEIFLDFAAHSPPPTEVKTQSSSLPESSKAFKSGLDVFKVRIDPDITLRRKAMIKRLKIESNSSCALFRLVEKDEFFLVPQPDWISDSLRREEVWFWRKHPNFKAIYNLFAGQYILQAQADEGKPLREEDVENYHVIFGNPGCGKSLGLWTAIIGFANARGKLNNDVCFGWISLSTNARFTIFQGRIYYDKVSFDDKDILVGHYSDIDNPIPIDVEIKFLIIDGISDTRLKSPNVQALLSTVKSKRGKLCQVVMTSSMQSVAPLQNHLPQTSIVALKLEPWSLEQYLTVCSDEQFFQQVVEQLGGSPGVVYTKAYMERLVQRKYSIAGISARWMFDYTTAEIILEVNRMIPKVTNYDYLLSGSIGTESSAAYNHLHYQDANHLVLFTSNFVLKTVASLCDRKALVSFCSQARQLAGNNPVLDGIVLEIDFLFHVKRKLIEQLQDKVKMVAFSNDVGEGKFEDEFNNTFSLVTEVIEFEKDVPNQAKLAAGVWYLPNVYNQGGYDAAQVLKREEHRYYLRFIQITRQLEHEIKLYYMRIFLDALNLWLQKLGLPLINEMEVVVLVPMEKAESYTHPKHWKVIGDWLDLNLRSSEVKVKPMISYRVAGYKRVLSN